MSAAEPPRPPSGRLRRALEVLRDEGPRSLWFKILGETVYRRTWVVERRLDDASPPPPAPAGWTIGELGVEDLDDVVSLRPGTDPEDIRERLRRGLRCFVGQHDGRAEHAIWLAFGSAPIDYLGREVPLGEREAYAFEAYTRPSARGHRISVAVADAMAAALAEEGYTRLLGVVMPENRAGVVSSWRWGYRPIGAMRRLRIGPWRRHLGSFAPSPAVARRLERRVWPDAPRHHAGAGGPPAAVDGAGRPGGPWPAS